MDSQNHVRIDLTVADEGGRRMESAPNGVSIGAVGLRNWQVDRIDAPAGMFDGYDVHFIKVNYELELELGLPWPTWFEIAFDFTSGEEEERVVVVDAIPRFGTYAETPKAYVLNQFLNFVPSADSASAHALLPATTDRVDVFGIGGSGVRWRHVSLDETGVRPGSYAAWVVLLTPTGQAEQRVGFSVRYDLPFGPGAEYRPTQSPNEFLLRLAPSTEAPGVVTPSLSASADESKGEYHPSVFICYAHDSPLHKESARQFGNLLVRNGIDVHMDQWDAAGRKDWAVWALRLINAVDFVVVLASPICRKVFDGQSEGSDNPGIRSESKVIKEKLHVLYDEWMAKVLPVVLPHELVDNIPEALQPWTADHYDIKQMNREGIDELLRAMTRVPRHTRPPLGELPPSVLKPLSGTES
ncbi:toll/interleukin-1 receptor domain-containing protein [Streptomyces sp. NPDC059477]|uniref:toll/interleukin-1 receptor domain-containing protein n=1 Tax=Streptomyces sp. NPDC059477 TaxID=3346847 RepID=UPI00367F23DE